MRLERELAPRPRQPVGVGQRVADRQAHVGRGELRLHAAVGEDARSRARSTAGARRSERGRRAKPKRRLASMTSSPLFIIVAESMVFFVPMRQVGCASAVCRFARSHRFARRAQKRTARGGEHDRGDAARGPRRPDTGRSRCARCRPAAGGRRCARAAATSSSPAATISSLFATATSMPRCDRRKDRVERDRTIRRGQHESRVRSRTATRNSPPGRRAAVVAIVDTEARGLLREQFDVASGRQTDYFEAIRVRGDDVERLRADRARRA